MLWVAISRKGRCLFHIKKTKGAVVSHHYKTECIKKRLLPFIKKHYPDGKYVFWPDLAPCHYSKETQDFMRAHNIKFVPKNLNPPNVPNLRLIERFWYEVKSLVYAEGWQPTNWDDLHDRVHKVMTKVGKSFGERYMSHVAKLVRDADRKGIFFNV